MELGTSLNVLTKRKTHTEIKWQGYNWLTQTNSHNEKIGYISNIEISKAIQNHFEFSGNCLKHIENSYIQSTFSSCIVHRSSRRCVTIVAVVVVLFSALFFSFPFCISSTQFTMLFIHMYNRDSLAAGSFFFIFSFTFYLVSGIWWYVCCSIFNFFFLSSFVWFFDLLRAPLLFLCILFFITISFIIMLLVILILFICAQVADIMRMSSKILFHPFWSVLFFWQTRFFIKANNTRMQSTTHARWIRSIEQLLLRVELLFGRIQ